jgi:membrane fusion protein (multidrug efflux system)
MLFMSACSSQQSEEETQGKIPYVKVAETTTRKYQPLLKFSGSVFAKKEANLSSVLPGRIEKFHVQEGEKVTRDQLIAELSGEMLTQAQIEYETFKKDFGRVSRLFEKGSLPEQKYDHVKAQYEAKKANYELIKKNTEIRAPFDGIITEKMIEAGESFLVINPGLEPGYSHASGVVRLMDYSCVEIEIEVSEKDYNHLQIGLPATVKVEAYKNQKWTGKITKLAHTFNTMTKTTKVTVEVKNEELKLKPGMFAKVEIPIAEREEIFVPMKAIYRQPGTGKDFVFVVRNSKTEKKPVERIFTDGDFVAVSGLTTGETIIVEGKSKVHNGTKVNISGN